MNEKSRIFWFSGTGNSLYAAKRLSEDMGGIGLEQITGEAPTQAVGGNGAKVGFVFPSYYCNLPRAVHYFVEKLEINPETYIFAIVTMGGPGQGSVAAMKNALAARGLRLDYGRGIKMPANNVLAYNPADPGKGSATRGKTDEQLRAIATEIMAGKRLIKSLPIILRNHFKNIEKLDVPFMVNENCTSCSLCEKICPVKNIRLEDGKPQWLRHCEICVACISWCPTMAINYGQKTKTRRRYRNPAIKVEELLINGGPR